MTRRRGAIARRTIPVAVPSPVQLVLGLALGLSLREVAALPRGDVPVAARLRRAA